MNRTASGKVATVGWCPICQVVYRWGRKASLPLNFARCPQHPEQNLQQTTIPAGNRRRIEDIDAPVYIDCLSGEKLNRVGHVYAVQTKLDAEWRGEFSICYAHDWQVVYGGKSSRVENAEKTARYYASSCCPYEVRIAVLDPKGNVISSRPVARDEKGN